MFYSLSKNDYNGMRAFMFINLKKLRENLIFFYFFFFKFRKVFNIVITIIQGGNVHLIIHK